MASLRVLLMLLVATLFLASAVAVGLDAAVAAEEPSDDNLDSFVNYWVAQDEAKSQSIQAEGTSGTTALPPRGRTIVVDPSGKGDYKKVQQAVDSVPKGNKKRIIIYIKNGVYRYEDSSGRPSLSM
jgi:pectin methylesterase-like acyl-CoA thioesterase